MEATNEHHCKSCCTYETRAEAFPNQIAGLAEHGSGSSAASAGHWQHLEQSYAVCEVQQLHRLLFMLLEHLHLCWVFFLYRLQALCKHVHSASHTVMGKCGQASAGRGVVLNTLHAAAWTRMICKLAMRRMLCSLSCSSSSKERLWLHRRFWLASSISKQILKLVTSCRCSTVCCCIFLLCRLPTKLTALL